MVSTVESFRGKLLYSKKSAAGEIDIIKSEMHLEYDFLYIHLKKYILYRFLLDDTDCYTDDLMELAAQSVAKAVNIPIRDLAGLDLSQTCTGSSSVVTKKILLMIALESDLAISFQPPESAAIGNVSDLTNIVLCKLSNC